MEKFTAFYPSAKYWAISIPDLSDHNQAGWYRKQLSEIVFEEVNGIYTLQVQRDGRILLKVESIDSTMDDGWAMGEKLIAVWAKYLAYLNIFYLFLDASMLAVENFGLFNFREITRRDAFRVRFENGVCTGGSIATESVSGGLQSQENYIYDGHLEIRHVVRLETFSHAIKNFDLVFHNPLLLKILSSFAKSLSEYKIGNYEFSIVLSWFLIEGSLQRRWLGVQGRLISKKNKGAFKKKSKPKRSELTISEISDLLKDNKKLSVDLHSKVTEVRRQRNKIAHEGNFVASFEDARGALSVLHTLIKQDWAIDFNLSDNFQLSWS